MQRTFSVYRQLTPVDLAEAILNFKGRSNPTAYSAGRPPTGAVRPEPCGSSRLRESRLKISAANPWEEFSQPDAPKLGLCFHGL